MVETRIKVPSKNDLETFILIKCIGDRWKYIYHLSALHS